MSKGFQTTMEMNRVATQTVKGSLFNIGASVITLVSGSVRSVILARLLTPEDFGIVALAMFFLSAVNQVTDLGFQKALIHRDTDLEKATSTHFVLKVGFSVLILLATVILAPVLNHFYPSQPQMASVLIILSCAQIINAMNVTPDVVLRKNMDFRYLAVLDVASSLSMTIVAPAMALMGFGFWSLVGEQVIPIMVKATGLWIIRRPWRPVLSIDKEMARWYFRFGVPVFASLNLTFLLDQFDDFWTGTALGMTCLGFYSRAYEFARYPRRVVASPITQVLFPAYAKLQNDRENLSKAYYRASSLIVRMGFLFSLVFLLIAPEFIRVFIGAKWLPMAFTFQLMLVYTLLDPLLVTSGHLITAVGRPQLLAKVKALQLLVFIPAVIVLAHYFGIDGVAAATDLMCITGLLLMVAQVRKFVDVSFWKLFRYPALGLVLGWGVASAVAAKVVIESDVVSLLVKGGLATAVYSGLLFICEYDEIRKALRILQSVLSRRVPPVA